jgi:hypothetical protein
MVIKEEMAGLVKSRLRRCKADPWPDKSKQCAAGRNVSEQAEFPLSYVRQLQLLALNNSEIKSFFTRTCSCPPVAFKYISKYIVDSTSTTEGSAARHWSSQDQITH